MEQRQIAERLVRAFLVATPLPVFCHPPRLAQGFEHATVGHLLAAGSVEAFDEAALHWPAYDYGVVDGSWVRQLVSTGRISAAVNLLIAKSLAKESNPVKLDAKRRADRRVSLPRHLKHVLNGAVLIPYRQLILARRSW